MCLALTFSSPPHCLIHHSFLFSVLPQQVFFFPKHKAAIVIFIKQKLVTHACARVCLCICKPTCIEIKTQAVVYTGMALVSSEHSFCRIQQCI